MWGRIKVKICGFVNPVLKEEGLWDLRIGGIKRGLLTKMRRAGAGGWTSLTLVRSISPRLNFNLNTTNIYTTFSPTAYCWNSVCSTATCTQIALLSILSNISLSVIVSTLLFPLGSIRDAWNFASLPSSHFFHTRGPSSFSRGKGSLSIPWWTCGLSYSTSGIGYVFRKCRLRAFLNKL